MLFRIEMPDGDIHAFELEAEFISGRFVRTAGLLKGIKFMQLTGTPWYLAHYPRNILASPAQVLEFEQARMLLDTYTAVDALPIPEVLTGY